MSVSRKEIYSYIATLFSGITKNIYRVTIPETLGTDAITNGFIVLTMDGIRDYSEFNSGTYSQVRVNVEYYVPSISTSSANGIMNTTKFDAAQNAVDTIIEAEYEKTNQAYTISKDDILSTDDFFTNKTNSFFVYIKSFIVTN